MTLSDFSIKSVIISAAAGATGYGLANVVGKGVQAMNISSKVLNAAVKVGAETVVDAAVNTAENYAKSGEVDIAGGFFGAVVAKGASEAVGALTQSSIKNAPEAKRLEKQAKKLERTNANNPKPSRQAAAAKARSNYDSHIKRKTAVRTGTAAGIGNNTTGKVLDAMDNKDEKKNTTVNGANSSKRIAFNKPPCFVAGTLVWTNKGIIPIESVMNGDSVLSYNIIKKKLEYQRVYNKHEKVSEYIVSIVIDDDNIIETTPEHSFYINSGQWRPADSLMIRDKLWLQSRHLKKFKNTKKISKQERVYNFEVTNNENYFVSKLGVLVHNSQDGSCR